MPTDRPLQRLREKYTQQLREEQLRLEEAENTSTGATVEDPAIAGEDFVPNDRFFDELFKGIVPVYEEIRESGESHFFQPVYWKGHCTGCHTEVRMDSAHVPSTVPTEIVESTENESNPHSETLLGNVPFRVVKVKMQDTTQKAINFNRAVLLATAIITTFLAMLALYAVVRYVIIKPLKHLRTVSDEIASGNYSLRADLHTNDEFEHMAESFNRMLRHLVDTHAQLREANDELDSRVDELAQVNMRLYETNRLKGDFLANMSHELRTPLNSIIGFSDVLREFDTLTEQQQRYVTNIGKSGRALLDMINDVLDLAKVESGKMEVHPTKFSVALIIEAQCDAMRPLSEEKNIDLDFQCPEGLPEIHTDQPKLQQIVTNLLSNAIKFTPEGGRITVTIERCDINGSPHMSLSVEDTGVGIAEDERAVIFQKFRQAQVTISEDNLTREFSGTGLGLSIVRELCKLLGGEISVESQLGQGSVFTITLPWTIPTHILDASRRLATIRAKDEQTGDGSTARSRSAASQPSDSRPADSQPTDSQPTDSQPTHSQRSSLGRTPQQESTT